MIKVLSETPKPGIPKPKTSKTETPKPEKTKLEIRVNKKKLRKLRKDFDELRHKFSKKEIDRYRKAFYVAKNKKYLSESEIKKTNKSLTEFTRSLRFKKFRGNDLDSVYYEDFGNYDYDDADYDDDKCRKIGSIRRLFKGFNSDYYKPTINDKGFDGRENNYIEYRSKGDRCENLSPKKYLNVIRPYLRDLINEHKPIMELNNSNNINHNNNRNNINNNNNRAEWKIQLTMKTNCISTKSFDDKRTIFSKSEPVEIFMGSNAKDVIDKLFNTLLQRFQKPQETSNEKGSKFIPHSVELLYHKFQRIDIKRGESYIVSPYWIASKKAAIHPENEKDNECFKWSIIAGLNYSKINEKELKKLLKFKRVDADFLSYQRG